MPPHVRQRGGVSRPIAAQHKAHTGPSVDRSSTRVHAAHVGASVTASSASTTRQK